MGDVENAHAYVVDLSVIFIASTRCRHAIASRSLTHGCHFDTNSRAAIRWHLRPVIADTRIVILRRHHPPVGLQQHPNRLPPSPFAQAKPRRLRCGFSKTTVDLHKATTTGRTGGGPGAFSKSGLSIVREGAEFVIRHGGRRIAGISSETADALIPRLRINATSPDFELPHQTPALNAGPATTQTIDEIRDMPYSTPAERTARNNASETYIRQLYGTQQSELRFVLPGGPGTGTKTARKVDVPVIDENGDALLLEVKNYAAGKVRLTESIRQQIDADSLLASAHPQNRPMWIFTDHPPADNLVEYLNESGIPWILYN